MVLKSIQLTDFRQFRGEQPAITFSTDPEKNVTIIHGDNGTGKTTLAQAFRWCLYDNTDFKDKLVLNKATAQQMTPADESTVKVKLVLEHSGRLYTITRTQRYTKQATGAVKANQTVLSVGYRADDGTQKFIPDGVQTDYEIKKILPEDLSHYFFFNGEKLDDMKEEIDKGKSSEFGKAVRGILGLSAFQEALRHLKSVIKSYEDSFDKGGDATIATLSSTIDKCNARIESIDQRLTEIDNEQSLTHSKCIKLGVEIDKNHRAPELNKELSKLKNDSNGLVSKRSTNTKKLLRVFNEKAHNYFAKKLMKEALELLVKSEKLDKGIPDIHQRTIDYLIERRECLCGAHIEPGEPGNKAFRSLKELEPFILPHSIGSEIRNFVDQCRLRADSGESLFEDISERYGDIRSFENDFAEIQASIDKINDALSALDDVGELQRQRMNAERYLEELKDESANLNQEKGNLNTERDNAERDRKNLNLRNKNNRVIEAHRTYAEQMYARIDTEYKNKESETRSELAEIVNEIFRSIYDGGFSLTVDEKYGIQIIVNDFEGYNSTIETSTAQSLSVIFAFIAGVTKMARQSKSGSESDMKTSEPYPLVMDAPLSAFDKTRIKTICDALPKAAEQVIVFIKDTDGELAEEHMGERVGVRYIFEKYNEFESKCLTR